VTLKQVSRSLEKRQNEIDSQSVRVTRTSLCRRPKRRKCHGDARVQNMKGRACPGAVEVCRDEQGGRAGDRGHGEKLTREAPAYGHTLFLCVETPWTARSRPQTRRSAATMFDMKKEMTMEIKEESRWRRLRVEVLEGAPGATRPGEHEKLYVVKGRRRSRGGAAVKRIPLRMELGTRRPEASVRQKCRKTLPHARRRSGGMAQHRMAERR